jgi:ABC-type Fe3+ transport system substrate-binding protein
VYESNTGRDWKERIVRRASLTVTTALAIVMVIPAGTAFGRDAAAPMLKGTVGPGFTITLKRSGTKVKVLKAGKYLFVVADKSPIHDFTLQKTGGTVRKVLTATSFTGVKKVTVKLAKGKWKYFCSVHPTTMFGFFTVK